MNDILIAYNSRPDDDAHSFFQSCADEARQACADLGCGYSIKTRDELTEQVIMQSMTSHSLCVFAAHGSSDSIVNEHDDEVISIRTTNYVFEGKGLYALPWHRNAPAPGTAAPPFWQGAGTRALCPWAPRRGSFW